MSQNNKKSKLNIIDYLIIAVILICLCATVFFFHNKGGIFTKYSYNIEYEITVEEILDDLADNISKGDIVCDSNTAFQIGTVVDTRTEKISYIDIYGRMTESANTQKLVVRVKATAEKHNGIFNVSGVDITKGTYIKFRVPSLEAFGTCTYVQQN